MADYNSQLPVRTQNDGDVVVKIADATVPSQQLAVDAAGKVNAKLNDGSGNLITSQANGGQQALDVGINVAGVQVDPRDVRALTSVDVVTSDQGAPNTAANGWPVKPTDGTNSQLYTAAGEATVSITQPLPSGSNTVGSVGVTNLPTTVDTDFGSVGANTLRSAAQIGNATGAADFNAGATGAQTLRVTANQGIANATPWNENIAQIAGAVPSATNALPAQITTGGAFVSPTNPLPVFVSVDSPGVEVNDYNTAAAVAAGATSNHDYTVTALKTLYLDQINASGSGKMKIEVQIETAAASGVFNSKFVEFNSTADPNMQISLKSSITVVAGARVRIIRTNKDNQAQDVYSTISGNEV